MIGTTPAVNYVASDEAALAFADKSDPVWAYLPDRGWMPYKLPMKGYIAAYAVQADKPTEGPSKYKADSDGD